MTVIQESTRLDTAVEKAAARLLELQHPGGWWVGELESNATMIAEHLFWLHVLGLRDPETDRLLANDLLARRRDDGTWSNWWEGPADLSTTIESSTRADKRSTTSAGRAGSPAAGCSPSASWPSSGSGRGSGSSPSRRK
jgi:hypothetical protein